MALIRRSLTTEKLRTTQWDKSNLWDITIEGAPNFGERGGWLPVTALELGFWGNGSEPVGSTSFSFPSLKTPPVITLSYLDSEDLRMTNFFSEWIRSLSSLDGFRYKTIEEARKRILIYKLNSLKEVIYYWTGTAYPEGNISYQGDSDGSVPLYSVNLKVVSGSFKWNK